MAHESVSSDLGVGIGLLLSLVAVGAAAAMGVVSPDATFASGMHVTAVPFAVAMVAAVLAIVAVHLYRGE